jgi:hypothetical protein
MFGLSPFFIFVILIVASRVAAVILTRRRRAVTRSVPAERDRNAAADDDVFEEEEPLPLSPQKPLRPAGESPGDFPAGATAATILPAAREAAAIKGGDHGGRPDVDIKPRPDFLGKLERYAPLKRAVIMAEILGPPKGIE